MKKQLNIREWSINFIMGIYDDPSRDTQIRAGWYDWFCKETSLRNKTRKMGKIVAKIKGEGKVDIDKNYVWFKNNCPLNGPLYDDFRFADMEDGEVQFTIQIDCCWNDHRFTVFGRKAKGGEFSEDPLFECDTAKELVAWFNEPWNK
jgi:hypothetical protein